MDEPHPVLAQYELIRQASQRMVEAARRSDWDALAVAESEAGALIACLRASAHRRIGWTGESRSRRFALLREILADDAEMRNLAHPWLKQVEVQLGIGRGFARREG